MRIAIILRTAASEENMVRSNTRWTLEKFSYNEIIARDNTSLVIIWLKDKSLADLDNLSDPDVLAEEIVENLESALDGFKAIIAKLKK